ncbi:hypothetical protein [Neisseria subflava]|uniref:hypothetical protein n=1 Tax=Neisseria subflava TaxID=28449 RepID=UPI00280B2502|nr:hypothetical protein [Neisseria subflava]
MKTQHKPLNHLKTLGLATQPTFGVSEIDSPFSLQSQPTACVPCGTHPTDGFKGHLKKRLRRLLHLPCDKGYLKNSCR